MDRYFKGMKMNFKYNVITAVILILIALLLQLLGII